MKRLIADQSQRDQALDISQSFIVQAPAGSGKTELISQRYLALLAACEKPESILAITFTRKAASEMRLRILEALESATRPAPEESHKYKTWQLAKAALHKDEQLNWNLLSSPSRLQVVTIDSFNARLTRQMPLLSKMGTSASPVEKAGPLFLEAARRALAEIESDQWQHDLSILMTHLGNNTQRIQQLLVSMLARRDQWLRHLAHAQDSQTRRHELEQAFYRFITEHLQFLKTSLPAGLLEELADLACFAAQNVDTDKQPLIAAWNNAEKLDLQETPDHLRYWQAFSELLLTTQNAPRKSITKAIGFPAPSEAKKDPERKQLLQQKKEALMAVIDELQLYPELLKAIIDLRNMPSLQYTDEQWLLVEALSRILILSAAHLRIVFAEQGQVDFTEIALSALQALGDDHNPTELALAMDYRIQHILVDEFQDTSQGQFKLLERLTYGWQPEDGRSLFLVGDPMQSIYRFREAEVGLYLKARRHGIGNINLQALYLQVNFRSQQGIVDWVNQHLKTAFSQQENITTGAVTYNPSEPFHPLLSDEAAVLHPYIERDDQQEARDIAEIVNRHLQNNDDSSIAILVRSRSHLLEIIETLKQNDIAFQAVELDRLQEQRAVIDLYTLTRALHHFADRLYWLALLRAPWCGLLLPDLLVIAEGQDDIIWNNCLDPEIQNRLSADGRLRLQNLVARLSPFLYQSGSMSLRTRIEYIWQTLGGNEINPSPTDRQAVNSYLLLLDQYDEGGHITDMELFNDAFEQLYAPADSQADGRLQIMTIHKSKGLEFDTVILPGLGKGGRPDETGLLEWLERPTPSGDTDLLMAPIKASEENGNDDISNSLKAVNKEKARHELTRLLYVALTRAKQYLHLFAHIDSQKKGPAKPTSNSMLEILWPLVGDEFKQTGDVQTIKNTTAQTSDNRPPLRRLNSDWQLPVTDALAVNMQTAETLTESEQTDLEFDWATETARHVGTLTHRYLEHMADKDLSQWQEQTIDDYRHAISNGLKNLGTQDNELDHAGGKVITALKNTLDDERGRWILKSHQLANSEYALTAKTDNGFKRYIIDRTFVDDNNIRWIIDYKTGSHEGGDKESFLNQEKERYQSQLEGYARLLRQLDSRPVRLGLYFPMLKGWREWDFQENTAWSWLA